MICRYENEEAQRRGDEQFTVSLAELETFFGLQYARGIYGKDHPVAFLWSKRYSNPIFYKNMSRDYFLEILKYLRFDDKPNRVRSGPALTSLHRLDKNLKILLINVKRSIRVNFR